MNMETTFMLRRVEFVLFNCQCAAIQLLKVELFFIFSASDTIRGSNDILDFLN